VIEKWFDHFEVGEQSTTQGRTITEADVVQFAMLSGDWNPLHTDSAYASKGPFGERIAHGMLILSVASGLTPLMSPYVQAFYGIDRLRFIAPTMFGDTIHVHTTLREMTIRDETSGLLTFDAEVRKSTDECCAVYAMKLLVARQPGPSA
jgi:3-hydroxybutyryl-CoA dehydratase